MNIMLLTSIYPGDYQDPSNSVTKVVHYFAKEWVESGNHVLVIHNAHRYPAAVHMLPEKVKNGFLKKRGYPILGLDYTKRSNYTLEGVRVCRLPLLKLKPHGLYPESSIRKQADLIESVAKREGFVPDVIIAHFGSPQIQLTPYLKQKYPQCPIALTLHDLVYVITKDFWIKNYLPYIDALGFRNKTDAVKAQEMLSLTRKPYICYSGVPEDLAEKSKPSTQKFDDISKRVKLLFVGRLVKRKHVDVVLNVLKKVKEFDYQFDIIGDGPEREALQGLVNGEMAGKVIFHGQMKREDIVEYYKTSHLFVMVSHGEAYGLVYLEAMAGGCIVIGSTGEGIDGIVEDGVNGFLIRSGDEKELLHTLKRILSSDRNTIEDISAKAIRTVGEMTDKAVAARYLNDVIAASKKE
jgi:glycosyltransferase involved in cell wall biosynthesis